MNMEQTNLYYAAWWRRFAALWIDALVLLPFSILQIALGRLSPRLYAALLIPFGLFFTGYLIFCHGRWGMTVGKRALGIRVCTLEGKPISWRQAFLRNAVDIVIMVLFWVAMLPAYLRIPTDGYAELTTRARFDLVRTFWPAWYPLVMKVEQGWIWSEFIVILFNKRRRALHDFIAGTIVVQKKPTRRQTMAVDPYSIDFSKEMKRLQKL